MSRAGLSLETSEDRYEAERRQGQALGAEDLESAWGWSGPAGSVRANRRAAFLIEQTGLRPGVSCLELGCGTGIFTELLAESGCELTAVELSEDTAARCRERLDGRAEVLVGNVETAEFLEGRTFDSIVGVSVLHHVNMDLCLTNTLEAGLKPGGAFAFSEPNLANPQIWAERNIRLVQRLRHTTPHETAFRAAELRGLFESRGFDVDVCEPFEFLHPATPRALVDPVLRIERRLEATRLRAVAGSVRIAGRSIRKQEPTSSVMEVS